VAELAKTEASQCALIKPRRSTTFSLLLASSMKLVAARQRPPAASGMRRPCFVCASVYPDRIDGSKEFNTPGGLFCRAWIFSGRPGLYLSSFGRRQVGSSLDCLQEIIELKVSISCPLCWHAMM